MRLRVSLRAAGLAAALGLLLELLYLRPVLADTIYLPMIYRAYSPAEQRLCRFGIGVSNVSGRIDSYNTTPLRIGWYADWAVTAGAPRPLGIDYLPMVRFKQTSATTYSYQPNGQALLARIAEMPGATWVIGNEPDRRVWQDDLEPQVYARGYHELYYLIKAADPSARIAAGSIVQPTPLRLQYLDLVLQNYQALYGEPMPVDVWNVHAFILNEVADGFPDAWGAGIPPGINATHGLVITPEQTDDLNLFRGFMIDFRTWMAAHGYQDRPLIITEYGELMPYTHGFPPERVNAYMNATFDYLNTAGGPLGYPRDGYRYVQRWAWYSLNDPGFNGQLYSEVTQALTPMGENFIAYTGAQRSYVNLAPVRLTRAPASAPPGQPTDFTLTAEFANNGNIETTVPVTVRFYNGDPNAPGSLIGARAGPAVLDGCGDSGSVSITWRARPEEIGTLYAMLDPDRAIPESNEDDNVMVLPQP